MISCLPASKNSLKIYHRYSGIPPSISSIIKWRENLKLFDYIIQGKAKKSNKKTRVLLNAGFLENLSCYAKTFSISNSSREMKTGTRSSLPSLPHLFVLNFMREKTRDSIMAIKISPSCLSG